MIDINKIMDFNNFREESLCKPISWDFLMTSGVEKELDKVSRIEGDIVTAVRPGAEPCSTGRSGGCSPACADGMRLRADDQEYIAVDGLRLADVCPVWIAPACARLGPGGGYVSREISTGYRVVHPFDVCICFIFWARVIFLRCSFD